MPNDETICVRRKNVYLKIQDLRATPRRTANEDAELKSLEKEFKQLLRCGDMK